MTASGPEDVCRQASEISQATSRRKVSQSRQVWTGGSAGGVANAGHITFEGRCMLVDPSPVELAEALAFSPSKKNGGEPLRGLSR